MLAIQAAYRVGCGLVTGAVPEAIFELIAGQIPEATWLIMPSTMGALNKEASRILLRHLYKVDALLIGPGWGVADETLECLKALISLPKRTSGKSSMGFTGDLTDMPEVPLPDIPPLVIDADGLKLLAKIKEWEKAIQSPAVLTPHPGEMAVLTGLAIEEIQKNRDTLAVRFAALWEKTIVLKGATTVIAAPDGRFTIIPMATSALATAGTGDVLAGMITGFITQGLDPYIASITAAWLHAQAGLLASKEFGQPASVMAGDVIRHIPAAIKKAAAFHMHRLLIYSLIGIRMLFYLCCAFFALAIFSCSHKQHLTLSALHCFCFACFNRVSAFATAYHWQISRLATVLHRSLAWSVINGLSWIRCGSPP